MTYAPFLTSSRVDLFRHCGASAIYSQTQGESAAALVGTEKHADVLRPGHLPAVMLDWFGREPQYEVGLAWHPVTGEARRMPPRRDAADGTAGAYSFDSPGWLGGTADALDVIGSTCGIVSVADLKTGHGQTRGSLGAPEDSGQLLSLAVYADAVLRAKYPGWRTARFRLAWLMHPADGQPFVEDAEVDPARVAGFARSLAARVAAVQGDVPRPRPGVWCTYCPCFDACPSQGAALKRLSELPGEVATDEDAALAYHALRAAEQTLANGKRALTAYVERRVAEARKLRDGAADRSVDLDSVSIGGGYALAVARPTTTRIDAAAAARYAQETGKIPSGAFKLTVSQESIRQAAPTADLDTIMADLDARGALDRVPVAPHVKLRRLRKSI